MGVPFLYQRISATTPITALISTKSPTTTFSVLHLDGTTDWIVSQRNALLAWTGHTISLSPRIQRQLSVAHWGSTHVTGRGLAALSAPGQIYQLTLAEGEEIVVHPGSVVAYSVSRDRPQPFRFKSSTLRLRVPSLTSWVWETDPVKKLCKTDTYKLLARAWWSLRTTARRTIWGDRLFLQFKGPTTIIMSSRGVRLADVLSKEQVNEIAEAPPGSVAAALEPLGQQQGQQQGQPLGQQQGQPQGQPQGQQQGEGDEGKADAKATAEQAPSALHVASVKRDGKVAFEDAKDLKEFVR